MRYSEVCFHLPSTQCMRLRVYVILSLPKTPRIVLRCFRAAFGLNAHSFSVRCLSERHVPSNRMSVLGGRGGVRLMRLWPNFLICAFVFTHRMLPVQLMKRLPMRRKSRPAWRITISSGTGESATLKLYRSQFSQPLVVNTHSAAPPVSRMRFVGCWFAVDSKSPEAQTPLVGHCQPARLRNESAWR